MTLTLADIKKHEKIGEEIHKLVHEILEYHPDRFSEQFVWAGRNKERGTEVYVPPLSVDQWNVWLRSKPQDEDEVHITWGPPTSSCSGESYTTFPLKWITNEELHKKKIAEFKKQHDEMQIRVDKEYKEKKRLNEYKENLEKEAEKDKEQKLETFKKSLSTKDSKTCKKC